ncbi:MAG: hypothetical protein H0T41_12220 [Rhodobacteraceae bacterium]|nr:hypothetical protein [Paracoccaceae bacterium]
MLVLGAERVFPTLPVLERLWALAGRPASAYAPEAERQLLLTTLQAGDALASAFYQRWAGLGQVGPKHVGYDPVERNLVRVRSVLAWLAEQRGEGALREGVTLPGVALACLVLWADARDGLDWRRHAELDRLVGELEPRASFRRTQPHRWSPG